MTSYPPSPERLDRSQFMRVVGLASDFDAEATRCAEAGSWYAACLMVGCALEAALLANVLALEPDMHADGTWPGGRKPPEEWGLADLIHFHLDQGWIVAPADPETFDAADLGHAVGIVTFIRNVVAHPGRLIREAPAIVLGEQAFATLYGILQETFEETNKLYEKDVGADTDPTMPLRDD
jgi:hypothetical protein